MNRIRLFFAAFCMAFISFLLISVEAEAQPMKVNYSLTGTPNPGSLESNAITATKPYHLVGVGRESSAATITHLDVRGGIVNSFKYKSNSLLPQILFNTVVYDRDVVYAAGQDSEMLVVATESNTGNVIWSKEYGGHYVQSMVFTQSTGMPMLVALGYMPNGADYDLAILMIDASNGDLIDARKIGHTINNVNVEDQPAEIITTRNGFMITATVDQNQLFIAELDNQLNLQWDQLYESPSPLKVKGIVAGGDEDYFVVIADTKGA